MAQKKKLQVFVSSTYTDLHEERQAAVEAILTAGHIPAGMELFAAGDESQMNVIKRWIDESDVYLLILGGRYGSVDPQSGKSYIQLEYEYAVSNNKPFFAVVIEESHLEEKLKRTGSQVIERDNPQQLKEFRMQVQTRMTRPWRDPRDIKLAIMETMAGFSQRDDLIGWVPRSEALTDAFTEEMSRLAKENAELRQRIADLRKQIEDPADYRTLRDLYDRLRAFTNYFSDIGRGLDRAVDSYNKGVGSLEARVMVTARKFKEHSGDEIETLTPLDKAVRQVGSDESGLFLDIRPEGEKPT